MPPTSPNPRVPGVISVLKEKNNWQTQHTTQNSLQDIWYLFHDIYHYMRGKFLCGLTIGTGKKNSDTLNTLNPTTSYSFDAQIQVPLSYIMSLIVIHLCSRSHIFTQPELKDIFKNLAWMGKSRWSRVWSITPWDKFSTINWCDITSLFSIDD